MTEKRFTLAYEKGNWWAVRDWDITLWKEEVIYLLNELHDETQFLKEECKHQQGQKMRLVAELKRLDYSEDDIRDIANGG